MKRALIGMILIVGIAVLIAVDHKSRQEQFAVLLREYDLSIGFDQTRGLIDKYFLEHGWFPDSIQQLDTILNKPTGTRIGANLEDVRETPYRFFVDPFSHEFYKYIPIVNEREGKPEGYYLLSAGIDGRYNNVSSDKLRLYDSAVFSYWSCYFGKSDLLVSSGLIDDWISAPSDYTGSLKNIFDGYDPTGRRSLPVIAEFSGVVSEISKRHFEIKDTNSEVKGICRIAPSIDSLAISVGDAVQVKGICSRVSLGDTTITFLNCVIVERGDFK